MKARLLCLAVVLSTLSIICAQAHAQLEFSGVGKMPFLGVTLPRKCWFKVVPGGAAIKGKTITLSWEQGGLMASNQTIVTSMSTPTSGSAAGNISKGDAIALDASVVANSEARLEVRKGVKLVDKKGKLLPIMKNKLYVVVSN